MLYPLKFKPRVKERIWGGQAILKKKGKTVARLSNTLASSLRFEFINRFTNKGFSAVGFLCSIFIWPVIASSPLITEEGPFAI